MAPISGELHRRSMAVAYIHTPSLCGSIYVKVHVFGVRMSNCVTQPYYIDMKIESLIRLRIVFDSLAFTLLCLKRSRFDARLPVCLHLQRLALCPYHLHTGMPHYILVF